MRPIDADALPYKTHKWRNPDGQEHEWNVVDKYDIDNAPTIETCKSAEQNVENVPSGDLISRQDAIEAVRYLIYNRQEKGAKPFKWWFIKQRLNAIPSADAVDCTDFIMWLIEIVLDEEDWELNAVGYGEIIARKLKKLGLLEVKDGYYIRHIENNAKESDLVYRPSADRQTDESCQDCPIYSADRPTEYNLETIADIVKQLGHLDGCIADMCGRPQVNSNSAEEQIAETCDRPKGEWIDVEHEPFCECSVCGAYIENLDDDFAFCPRAGRICVPKNKQRISPQVTQ